MRQLIESCCVLSARAMGLENRRVGRRRRKNLREKITLHECSRVCAVGDLGLGIALWEKKDIATKQIREECVVL